MISFIKNVYKEKAEKTDSIQSAEIIALVSQSDGVDYYDVRLDGEYFKKVPCPIPGWLQKQMEADIAFGILLTEDRKVNFERKPLYNSGDSVEMTFVRGNKHMPKISLESSREKLEPMEIVYI